MHCDVIILNASFRQSRDTQEEEIAVKIRAPYLYNFTTTYRYNNLGGKAAYFWRCLTPMPNISLAHAQEEHAGDRVFSIVLNGVYGPL